MPTGDAFSTDFEELMNDRFLFGSPAEVAEQILVLQRRFGINTLILGIHWVGMPASLAMEQMQLISEQVFPGRALRRLTNQGNHVMKIGAVMFFTSDSMQPAALGRELEERGFESLWVPEHTHIPLTRKTPYPGGGPLIRPYYDIYDPFIALNTAAAVTTNLKIGTGVCLVPQRDPIVTAKMVSSLDRVSNGRFLFGVGNGWNQDEIENHGTDFKTRHKLGRERIEAMKAIWTQDEPEYHGELVNIEQMNQWPKPVQQAASADHRRRRLPLCRAPRHPLRQRLDPARRPAGERWRRRGDQQVPRHGERSRPRSRCTADHHLPRARGSRRNCASARKSASTASCSRCRRTRKPRSCQSSTAGRR